MLLYPEFRQRLIHNANRFSQFPFCRSKHHPIIHEPDIHQRAAAGLAALREPTDPLLALLRRAAGDEQLDVRLVAIRALAKAGDQQVMPVAIEALREDEPRIAALCLAISRRRST